MPQRSTPPPPGVRATFGVLDPPVALPGGQGRAWRVGPLVLKPVGADPVVAEEVRWLGAALAPSMDGVRVAVPVPATDRRWVVDGWAATTFLEGSPAGWRWGEVLAAGRAFHGAVAHLPRPSFLDRRRTPWDVGDRGAWGESAPEVRTAGLRPLVSALAARRAPVEEPPQLVHGDLAGNVLLAAGGGPPAILDLSPYWRPPSWALAVVAVDAMAWSDADPEAFEGIDPQCLVRAMLYRLVTDDAFGQDTSAVNEPVVDWILSRRR